jgi:phage repressor protein C with HTH and peptisase S24 domain/DNA-binding XRE family transcriptional regulator
MVRRAKSPKQTHTGLYHAREARGMSRGELVRKAGVSKQQLSRLENGLIRLRLDHLKPFAPHLGYSPEQILLWGRLPQGMENAPESMDLRRGSGDKGSKEKSSVEVRELDVHAPVARGRSSQHLKRENWGFPGTFVREQLHASASQLLVLEMDGDSMAPTIMSGERVVVDTGHKNPSPDGLYAIRDTFDHAIIRRLQVLRAANSTRLKVICDNPRQASEEMPLSELQIVGKVVCCLKLL